MPQLDLFGSLFETSSEEKKPEDSQPVLEKSLPAVSANDEVFYSLIEITEDRQEAEIFEDTFEIAENVEMNKQTAKEAQQEIFSLPDVENIQEALASATTEKSTSESGFDEPTDARQNTLPERNEPKPNQFDESKERTIGDKEFEVSLENKPALDTSGTKDNVKKEPQKRGRKSLNEIEADVDLIEVPEDEVLFQKQYYAISEVAKWFRVNASLLRFWEKEFDILKPKKNRKGDRLFRPEDVKNLQLIYQLLRQRKYTIEGAKEYIKTNKKKADTEMELVNTLQKFKNFLLDLKVNLQ